MQDLFRPEGLHHPRLGAGELAFALVAFGAIAPAGAATLQVHVDQGVTEPIPLAIPDFLGSPQAGKDIAGVVRGDLERSGLFRSLPPASFIEKIADINTPPRFGDWRTIQAQGLGRAAKPAPATGHGTAMPTPRRNGKAKAIAVPLA